MPQSVLAKKSIIVIFAYSPTGLGHLRVSDALYNGLPKSITPLLLGAQDKSLSNLYRFISIHPITRGIMEFFQKGEAEALFSSVYRWTLRKNHRLLYQQTLTILEERLDLPDTVLIIATHFGLAHQFASIKEKIEKVTKVRFILIVQVTDDSPQQMWYIEGADAIFVPSEQTKKEFLSYGKKSNLSPVPFYVTPYPISPLLKENLSPSRLESRKIQVSRDSDSSIHIAVPISGAAVYTEFYTALIAKLSEGARTFVFHIVAKNAPYNKSFLSQLLPLQHCKLYVSEHDRGVVNLYRTLYQKETISFDITKPSEQAFKALFEPTETGGSILLFLEPVGRQESDNIDFLRRHHLIPDLSEKKLLDKFCRTEINLSESEEGKNLLHNAHAWRGIELPNEPSKASAMIQYCLNNRIFERMFSYTGRSPYAKSHEIEVRSDGVELFWKKVEELIVSKKISEKVVGHNSSPNVFSER